MEVDFQDWDQRGEESDGWGFSSFSPFSSLGSPTSSSSLSYDAYSTSSSNTADQFDTLFLLAHDFFILTLIFVFILLFYSSSSSPQSRELLSTVYSYAPVVCEPNSAAKFPRPGFGHAFDGGLPLNPAWSYRRSNHLKWSLYSHARSSPLSTPASFFPIPPAAPWTPADFPSHPLNFSHTALYAWIDADGDVLFTASDSLAQKPAFRTLGYISSDLSAATPQIPRLHLFNTLHFPVAYAELLSTLTNPPLSLFSHIYSLLSSTFDIIISIISSTDAEHSIKNNEHSIKNNEHSIKNNEHSTQKNDVDILFKLQDDHSFLSPSTDNSFLSTRLWRLTSAQQEHLGYFQETVHQQFWWSSKVKLVYSFHVFDSQGNFLFCLRRSSSSSFTYGIYTSSSSSSSLVSSPSSSTSSKLATPLSTSPDHSPLYIIHRADRSSRSRLPSTSTLRTFPWIITSNNLKEPFLINPQLLFLSLSRFVFHIETSLFADAEGALSI